MNRVVAGDYKGQGVMSSFGSPVITLPWLKTLKIDKETVEEHEVITEESRKSATSAVGRAFVGSLFLGPVGLAAGLSAKSKGTYQIAIQFKDGKRSLLEVDGKIYKAIVQKLF